MDFESVGVVIMYYEGNTHRLHGKTPKGEVGEVSRKSARLYVKNRGATHVLCTPIRNGLLEVKLEGG